MNHGLHLRSRLPLGCVLLLAFISGCLFALVLIALACLTVSHLL